MSNAVNIRHEAADITTAIEDDLLAQVRDMQTRLTKLESRDTRSLLGKLFGKGSVAALLIAVFLIGGTAWAATYTVFGRGLESCGTWTADRTTDGDIVLIAWVGGYMTAVSTWVEIGSGPVSESDLRGAAAWIDNYCKENPLDDMGTAALRLIVAIKTK